VGCDLLKGIVHSKMRILLSFTHPHVSTNLYDFPLLMDLLKLEYDALF